MHFGPTWGYKQSFNSIKICIIFFYEYQGKYMQLLSSHYLCWTWCHEEYSKLSWLNGWVRFIMPFLLIYSFCHYIITNKYIAAFHSNSEYFNNCCLWRWQVLKMTQEQKINVPLKMKVSNQPGVHGYQINSFQHFITINLF